MFCALQEASAKGYEAVVQLLLNNGADINTQCREYGNALYTVSSQGHWEIVQLVLANGADTNAKGGEYENVPVHRMVSMRWLCGSS